MEHVICNSCGGIVDASQLHLGSDGMREFAALLRNSSIQATVIDVSCGRGQTIFDCADNNMGRDGAAALQGVVGERLTSLNIAGDVSSQGPNYLGNGLSDSAFQTGLNLASSRFLLALDVSSRCDCTNIDSSGNSIGPLGATNLQQFLQRHENITSLKLDG
jgi:hypothetical protein